MSHIEKKKINGRVYLYRYESYRDESGRPRKRMLEYLGPESPRKTAAKPDSSHIVRKKLNGRFYLYRYRSYRDVNGKVRKKMICYIGPEPDAAKTYREHRETRDEKS